MDSHNTSISSTIFGFESNRELRAKLTEVRVEKEEIEKRRKELSATLMERLQIDAMVKERVGDLYVQSLKFSKYLEDNVGRITHGNFESNERNELKEKVAGFTRDIFGVCQHLNAKFDDLMTVGKAQSDAKAEIKSLNKVIEEVRQEIADLKMKVEEKESTIAVLIKKTADTQHFDQLKLKLDEVKMEMIRQKEDLDLKDIAQARLLTQLKDKDSLIEELERNAKAAATVPKSQTGPILELTPIPTNLPLQQSLPFVPLKQVVAPGKPRIAKFTSANGPSDLFFKRI